MVRVPVPRHTIALGDYNWTNMGMSVILGVLPEARKIELSPIL
jgi:hypothetical protein